MGVVGVIVRFAVFYIIAVALAAVIGNYFDLKSNIVVNFAILFAVTAIPANSFAKKNGRYFTTAERRTVIAGISIVSLLYQFGFLAASGKMSTLSSGALLFVYGFGTLITVLAIAATIEFVSRSLVKTGVIRKNRKGSE